MFKSSNEGKASCENGRNGLDLSHNNTLKYRHLNFVEVGLVPVYKQLCELCGGRWVCVRFLIYSNVGCRELNDNTQLHAAVDIYHNTGIRNGSLVFNVRLCDSVVRSLSGLALNFQRQLLQDSTIICWLEEADGE